MITANSRTTGVMSCSLTASATVTGSVRTSQIVAAARGGPRFSDRLLRWSPDPTGGIWNATKETELPG